VSSGAVGRDATVRVRVLVVEDDPGIARSLVRGLERAGYEAWSVDCGRAALVVEPVPDLVLLDLGLPDLDGVEVCRVLRRRSDAAVIVVTARGEEGDRVSALDQGADDYLVKPFGLAELLARVRAVLRRTRPQVPELLRCGPLSVDPRTRKVTVGGREAVLTAKEFDILECLAVDPGRVDAAGDPGAGLGRALVRARQGAGRPHGGAAPQVGGSGAGGDGLRPGFSAG